MTPYIDLVRQSRFDPTHIRHVGPIAYSFPLTLEFVKGGSMGLLEDIVRTSGIPHSNHHFQRIHFGKVVSGNWDTSLLGDAHETSHL